MNFFLGIVGLCLLSGYYFLLYLLAGAYHAEVSPIVFVVLFLLPIVWMVILDNLETDGFSAFFYALFFTATGVSALSFLRWIL